MGPPGPSLPIPSNLGHTHTYTHTPYLSCVFYLCCLEWLTAWDLYLGEEKRKSGSLGAKEGQRMPGGELGHHSLSLGTAASPPNPRVPLSTPKEVALVYSEDSVTVSLFPEI